ncbi:MULTISPECIES: PTS sugar transporter subunit IIA [unclassified Sporolactobacillus]|uniref:PTS sugar transporter subunit IIA n=1 Tax=unclassified Sporolactobacillus TaxID=2628533 RepID=UPI002368DBFF|nr:PTS glucose transporter subunit IIA [Sporolactobacillus sp. CQH2019]MDD9149949.1 PTS glucose transporter subunit IIA [Sporolactobacillus sp. CQH2019]
MFKLFRKTAVADDQIYAPASGRLIQLAEVNDPVFSSKMMGDGFAIIPADGSIASPVSGRIMTVFETKHAIGIKMENGLEVLVHLGINTVDLKGAPFEVFVKEGQPVKGGDKLAFMDLDQVRAAKKEDTVMIVFTNSEALKELRVDASKGMVENGAVIGKAAAVQ